MAKAPAIESKEIHYKYVDGTKIVIIGSDTIAIRQKAYDLATTPVIIPPTVPQQTDIKVRSISIQELGSSKGLKNENLKVVGGNYNDQYWLQDFDNVNIDLSGCTFGTKGMPVFELRGLVKDLTLQGGRAIGTTHALYKLRGASKNLTVDGVYVENSGAILEGAGEITDNGFNSINENFKLINSKAYNCPNVGTLVWLAAADSFLFENNVFDKINDGTNIHNGIIYIAGNGKISGNKLTNHQGNLARVQPMQVIGSGKIVEISNNIVWNSRKYGAFELQVYSDQRKKAFMPANVVIKNNTAGDLNINKDWEAKLVDKYDTYGTITLIDNLGFNMVQSNGKPIISLFNNAGGEVGKTVVTETGSVYKATKNETVDANLKSKIAGVGAQ